jgi:Zn-finger nucleic acid-binding protein
MAGNQVINCAGCGRVNRLPRTACMWCGDPLPQSEADLEAEGAAEMPPVVDEFDGAFSSPRAPHAALEKIDVGPFTMLRCPETKGLFMSEHVLNILVERQAEKVLEAEKLTTGQLRQQVQRFAPEQRIEYIACPICGQQMQRKNYLKSSGVIIDQCLAHGVWLDEEELQQILQFIASGGQALAKALAAEAAEQMRLSPYRSRHHGVSNLVYMRATRHFGWRFF